MIHTKFWFIWPSSFRGDDFLEINQSEARISCGSHVFLTDRDEMNSLYRGLAIDASYQASVHLANRFQRRRLKQIGQSERIIAYCGHVCYWIGTKWAILIEDMPRMVPTKCRFIWQSSFRGEYFFRNQPIRNKNCLWRPCLLTDRHEMSNLYRGPAIDASYQVSMHLAKPF